MQQLNQGGGLVLQANVFPPVVAMDVGFGHSSKFTFSVVWQAAANHAIGKLNHKPSSENRVRFAVDFSRRSV
jgi:hypothetical protein